MNPWRAIVGGSIGAGVSAVILGAHALLETYMPSVLEALATEDVSTVARALIALVGFVIGGVWWLFAGEARP